PLRWRAIEAMSGASPDRKPVIIDLLDLIASEERQLTYEHDVPHVDITNELVCMWFDDLYHPDDAFFVSCFSTDELIALGEFHLFYDQRDELLPESKGTVRTWLADRSWREIMGKAQETLSRIAP
ncbi:MAG TPA: hypothetical protein PK760_05725, partial [Flavobacteriales bacterium]|nr:hypothetical protein [Flavobacteriales bacterium]